MEAHWTERSIEDYRFRIVADFISQIEEKMNSETTSQDELATILGVTKGRVSQMLNNPGNITFNNIVKLSRALKMKVSLVAYEDDDPRNTKGPINSDIFKICWERQGKPNNFWSLKEVDQPMKTADSSLHIANNFDKYTYMDSFKNFTILKTAKAKDFDIKNLKQLIAV